MSLKKGFDEYDSSFEGDSFQPPQKVKTQNYGASTSSNSKYDPLLQPKMAQRSNTGIPSREYLNDLSCMEIGRALNFHQRSMTAYDRHRMLIDQYVLYHPSCEKFLKRDTSRDKRDMDVVREHHQFLWESEDQAESWEQLLAKKYYDKLFKEYCICDLSRFKENKIGMRWRTESEVKSGRGQFTCGNKRCTCNVALKSWEMNFGYMEKNVKKNALIKLRLCEPCSLMLNYCSKRKEVIRKKKKKRSKSDKIERKGKSKESSRKNVVEEENETVDKGGGEKTDEDIWKGPSKILDEKSREDEFEEYLEDLFL